MNKAELFDTLERDRSILTEGGLIQLLKIYFTGKKYHVPENGNTPLPRNYRIWVDDQENTYELQKYIEFLKEINAYRFVLIPDNTYSIIAHKNLFEIVDKAIDIINNKE